MASVLHIEIDKLRLLLLKQKFQNELEDNINNESYDAARKLSVCKLLAVLDTGTNNSKKKLDSYFELINNESFNKTWARLNDFNKIVKIKDYLKAKYSTNEHYDTIERTVVGFVAEKKLNSGKSVVYDQKNQIILSIPQLIVDEKGNASIK